MKISITRIEKKYTPWMVRYYVDGKEHRNFRKTKREAEDLRGKIRDRYRETGRSAFNLSKEAISDVLAAQTLLDGRLSLTEAARYWLANADEATEVTLEELEEEFLADKKRNVSDLYYRQLKSKVRAFCKGVGSGRRIGTITTRELDKYLAALPHVPESVANVRRILGTLFAHAVKKEYISRNPATYSGKPTVKRDTPQFLTAEQVKTLLTKATELDPALVTPLALSAYFGIRSYEVCRLREEAINREDRTIYIAPSVAKGGKARLIDNLPDKCWEAIERPLKPVSSQMLIRRRRKIYEAAGIEWFNSALRKTFITHAVAAFQSADRVALVVGHRSTSTLHNHYRGLISKAAGKKYFT